MNSKTEKQTELNMNDRLKKIKKPKNPYNINISFNINNPKKVISNQINKTIKVNHYSFSPQHQLSKLNKINISKVLNPSTKSYSSSLFKSKDLLKQQCMKDLNKFQCYLENSCFLKKHKKSKTKPYDIETKSKSDFTYSTSFLSMPFPGNDPLPDVAIKKLNKMKKYFLQKIGSMDISAPEDTANHSSDLINQSKNLKTSQLKLYDSRNERKEINSKKIQDNDDIMTDKLSEYQYQNLISYQNQNEEKQNSQALKQKERQDFEQNDTFPQIVFDNLNSMTIKNQYLRHHSKFLRENMDLFKKQQQNKNNKQSNRISFDQLQADIKSKIINPFDETYRKVGKKNKKQVKSKIVIDNKSETNAMKEKIKIIQDVLLKSDSSKSILKIGQKSQKLLINKLETGSKVEDFYKKNVKKQYVIKTEIQLPNDLVNEIKQFESQTLTDNFVQKDLLQQKKRGQQTKMEKQLIDKMNYLEFLSERNEQVDRKETRQLIQSYLNLIQEHLNIHNEAKNRIKSESFGEVPSVTDIRYIDESQKSESYQIYPELSASRIKKDSQNTENNEENTSEVNSYVYGDQISNAPQQINYSPQRSQKIQLQRQMREELAKRLSSQFFQKQQSKDQDSLKIILNSNLQEHSVKQSNSDLQYEKNTEEISQVQKVQINFVHIQNNNYEKFSHQMETLLGFIKQNINFNSTDKQILKDLYQKILEISNPQNDFPIDVHSKNKAQPEEIFILKEKEASPPISLVKTPKKQKNETIIKKPNLHKRSYSTQKDTTKVPIHIVQSSDINLWDLILVEERLNKKYNQITYQKQKQLFQIETDPTLTYQQYQQKIEQLENWQNQAKRQILQTKKQIKSGIMNLRKILTPQSDRIPFRMKSFSQKYLIPKFNQIEMSLILSSNQGQEKIIRKNERKNFNVDQNQRKDKKKYPKVSIILDSIFIQEAETSDKNQKFAEQSNQFYEENQKGRLKIKKEKKTSKFNQNEGINCQDEFPSIQLFRTSSRYKDLLEEDQEKKSIQSSKSSNSSQIYNNEAIYSQSTDEKQDFIDLLKIQRYKLGDFHQLSNELDSQKIVDAISQLPEIISQTTIEPKKLSLTNSNITQEDKIDICEFILLDLCIQMYQETLDLQDSQIKKGGCKISSMHRIMKQIFAFIKKEKKKPKKKGPKIGIHTELQTVKEYIQKLKNYVQQLPQKSKSSSKEQNDLLINRINSPIGPTAVQILKTMRFYQDEIFQSNEQYLSPEFSQNQGLNSLVLPVYVFTDFEERLQQQKQFVFDTYFEDPEKEKNRLGFLKNVTHVHHKALFDALNEMLDFERPWGIWGKPFPWKRRSDKMKVLSSGKLKSCLKKSCQKVIECGMYMCGLLVDKQESLVKNTTVSERYLQEVKQDRMSKMIINDFIENENRFYFLDDEQAQILLETSYVVWLLLIQEAVKEINLLKERRI